MSGYMDILVDTRRKNSVIRDGIGSCGTKNYRRQLDRSVSAHDSVYWPAIPDRYKYLWAYVIRKSTCLRASHIVLTFDSYVYLSRTVVWQLPLIITGYRGAKSQLKNTLGINGKKFRCCGRKLASQHCGYEQTESISIQGTSAIIQSRIYCLLLWYLETQTQEYTGL